MFSVLAGWTVRAIAVVTVLALASRSLFGAAVATVAFGLYVSVGYDELYDRVNRRFHLGRGSDFAFRTVLFGVGAAVVAGVFALLGVVDPTGTFVGMDPSSNPGLAALVDGFVAFPVGFVLLVTGGLLVVEGSGLLFRRVVLARAQAYVGVSEPSGLVAMTGTVTDPAERPAPAAGESVADGSDGGNRGRVEANDSTGGSGQSPDVGSSGSRNAGDETATSPTSIAGTTGREVAGAQSPGGDGDRPADPEPSPDADAGRGGPGDAAGTGSDGGAAVSDPATFDDGDLQVQVEDDGDGDRRSTDGGRPVTDGGRPLGEAVDGTTVTDGGDAGDGPELLALAAYDPDDPVVVDVEAREIVATRRECHPDDWIETVVSFLADDFEAEHGVDLREDREAHHRLRIVAKRVREDLRERTETEVLLPFIAEVPGEGAIHIRRTFSVVPPSRDGYVRPPFATMDEAPATRPDPGSIPDVEDRFVTGDAVRGRGPTGAGAGAAVESDDATVFDATGNRVDGAVPSTGPGDAGRVQSDDASPATFDDDPPGEPVEFADETVVDAEPVRPKGRSVIAPHTGEPSVAYRHVSRENRTRTLDLRTKTLAVSGRSLEAFESDVVPFDLRTFGTRVHVDPDDPLLLLDTDVAELEDGRFTYGSTVTEGDTVTVVGVLDEDVDDPGLDYVLRDGGPGGVVVASVDSGNLPGRLTRESLLRFGVGVPLLVAGAALTPLVDLGTLVALGTAGTLLGGAAAGAYVAAGLVPEGIKERFRGAVGGLFG